MRKCQHLLPTGKTGPGKKKEKSLGDIVLYICRLILIKIIINWKNEPTCRLTQIALQKSASPMITNVSHWRFVNFRRKFRMLTDDEVLSVTGSYLLLVSLFFTSNVFILFWTSKKHKIDNSYARTKKKSKRMKSDWIVRFRRLFNNSTIHLTHIYKHKELCGYTWLRALFEIVAIILQQCLKQILNTIS